MKKEEILVSGMGIAVVFAATFFIRIPNALDGYMNLGDGMIMLFCSITSPLGGFLIGGVGSALADLIGGYPHFMIFTLFIKGLEGCIIAYLYIRLPKRYRFITFIIASFIMVSGYFFAQWFISQSFELALISIPENLIQASIAIIITMLCINRFNSIAKLHKLEYKKMS